MVNRLQTGSRRDRHELHREPSRIDRSPGPFNHLDALAQPEKPQDSEDDDDCADDIHYAVHGISFRVV